MSPEPPGAAPRSARKVDRRLGLRRDDVLVRDKAARIEVRGVHLVGQRRTACPSQIRLRLARAARNYTADSCSGRRPGLAAAAHVLVVKAVHLAIGARDAARAVARRSKTRMNRARCPTWFQRDRLERNLLVGSVITVRCRLGAGKRVKQIVKRAILLNDDDDVLNLAALRVVPHAARAARATDGRLIGRAAAQPHRCGRRYRCKPRGRARRPRLSVARSKVDYNACAFSLR